jgi:hypothetical protein
MVQMSAREDHHRLRGKLADGPGLDPWPLIQGIAGAFHHGWLARTHGSRFAFAPLGRIVALFEPLGDATLVSVALSVLPCCPV